MGILQKLTLEEIEEMKQMMLRKKERSDVAIPAHNGKTVKNHIQSSKTENNTLSSNLQLQAKQDIERFLLTRQSLMYNERDLQMQLAVALMASGHYDDVDVEYYLPTKGTNLLEGYEWDSNMRVDIVLRKGGEYLPIELKYTTIKLVRDVERYGLVVKNMEILRNQGAQDIIRYNVWKDVRRIELLKKLFPGVKGGLVVFLTCDKSFLSEPRPESTCRPFSTAEKEQPVGNCIMDWNGNPTIAKDHPSFILEGMYRIAWHPILIDGINFYYTIIEI